MAKKLMIGIPFNSGMGAAFHLSVTNLAHHLSCNGWDVDINYAEGSLLSAQRNNITTAATKGGYDLLFIDSDMAFTVPAAMKIISSNHDVIGGLYHARRPPYHPLVFGEDLTDTKFVFRSMFYQDIPKEPFMCKGLGTGFLLIRHPALLEIKAYCDENKDRPFNFIQLENGDQYGEDLSFFRRCNLAGIDVWCEPGVDIGHVATQVVTRETHMLHVGKHSHYCNDFDGWMTVRELNWLYNEAKTMGSIIEVGSWKGRSTHALLSACSGIVTAVDTWQGSAGEAAHTKATERDIYEDFLKNCGKFKNLNPVRMKSVEAAMVLPDVDMIFIDASHEYHEVLDDIRAWDSKATRMICGHDYTGWPGVQKAVNEYYGVENISISDSIWYVRKG